MRMQRDGWRNLSAGLLIVTALSAGLLSGCFSSGSEASPPDGSGGPPEPDFVEADVSHRDDLTGEQAVDWTRYEIVSEMAVRLFFAMGSPKCYGARAVVEETDAAVEVAVITGILPDAPRTCTADAVEASILVETTAPVADREIISLPDPDLK